MDAVSQMTEQEILFAEQVAAQCPVAGVARLWEEWLERESDE